MAENNFTKAKELREGQDLTTQYNCYHLITMQKSENRKDYFITRIIKLSTVFNHTLNHIGQRSTQTWSLPLSSVRESILAKKDSI